MGKKQKTSKSATLNDEEKKEGEYSNALDKLIKLDKKNANFDLIDVKLHKKLKVRNCPNQTFNSGSQNTTDFLLRLFWKHVNGYYFRKIDIMEIERLDYLDCLITQKIKQSKQKYQHYESYWACQEFISQNYKTPNNKDQTLSLLNYKNLIKHIFIASEIYQLQELDMNYEHLLKLKESAQISNQSYKEDPMKALLEEEEKLTIIVDEIIKNNDKAQEPSEETIEFFKSKSYLERQEFLQKQREQQLKELNKQKKDQNSLNNNVNEQIFLNNKGIQEEIDDLVKQLSEINDENKKNLDQLSNKVTVEVSFGNILFNETDKQKEKESEQEKQGLDMKTIQELREKHYQRVSGPENLNLQVKYLLKIIQKLENQQISEGICSISACRPYSFKHLNPHKKYIDLNLPQFEDNCNLEDIDESYFEISSEEDEEIENEDFQNTDNTINNNSNELSMEQSKNSNFSSKRSRHSNYKNLQKTDDNVVFSTGSSSINNRKKQEVQEIKDNSQINLNNIVNDQSNSNSEDFEKSQSTTLLLEEYREQQASIDKPFQRSRFIYEVNFEDSVNEKPKWVEEKDLLFYNSFREQTLFQCYQTTQKCQFQYTSQNKIGFDNIKQNRSEPCKVKGLTLKQIIKQMKKDYFDSLKKEETIGSNSSISNQQKQKKGSSKGNLKNNQNQKIEEQNIDISTSTQVMREFSICHHCKQFIPVKHLIPCTYKSSVLGLPVLNQNVTDPFLSQQMDLDTIPKKAKYGCGQAYIQKDNDYVCLRKFCKPCLKQNYDVILSELNKNEFLCPVCSGTCFCTRCLRNDMITKIKGMFLLMGGEPSIIYQGTKTEEFLRPQVYEEIQKKYWEEIGSSHLNPLQRPNQIKTIQRMKTLKSDIEKIMNLALSVQRREKLKSKQLCNKMSLFQQKVQFLQGCAYKPIDDFVNMQDEQSYYDEKFTTLKEKNVQKALYQQQQLDILLENQQQSKQNYMHISFSEQQEQIQAIKEKNQQNLIMEEVPQQSLESIQENNIHLNEQQQIQQQLQNNNHSLPFRSIDQQQQQFIAVMKQQKQFNLKKTIFKRTGRKQDIQPKQEKQKINLKCLKHKKYRKFLEKLDPTRYYKDETLQKYQEQEREVTLRRESIKKKYMSKMRELKLKKIKREKERQLKIKMREKEIKQKLELKEEKNKQKEDEKLQKEQERLKKQEEKQKKEEEKQLKQLEKQKKLEEKLKQEKEKQGKKQEKSSKKSQDQSSSKLDDNSSSLNIKKTKEKSEKKQKQKQSQQQQQQQQQVNYNYELQIKNSNLNMGKINKKNSQNNENLLGKRKSSNISNISQTEKSSTRSKKIKVNNDSDKQNIQNKPKKIVKSNKK